MTPLAKRPRPSDAADDHTFGMGSYYQTLPPTYLTRPSPNPTATTLDGPSTGSYLAPHYEPAPNGALNGAMGAAGGLTSPLMASHLSVRSLHQSSGAEDNDDPIQGGAAKSISTQSAQARGRGRGGGRGRGRGRGRGAATTGTATTTHLDRAPYATHEKMVLPNGTTKGHAETEDEAPPNPLIFQCRQCHRLLGDSLSFVATDTELGYVILSNTTQCVVQDAAYSTSTDPSFKDVGSTFNNLRCVGCNVTIGRSYRTTPRDLDDLRDFFSLEVDGIYTYQLGSNWTREVDDDDNNHDDEEEDQITADQDADGNGEGEGASRKGNKRTRDSMVLGYTPAATGDIAGLENKMERTRTLTIELSNRLIKAEEDIQRYSALLEKVLADRESGVQIDEPKPDVLEEEPQPHPETQPTIVTSTATFTLTPAPLESQDITAPTSHPIPESSEAVTRKESTTPPPTEKASTIKQEEDSSQPQSRVTRSSGRTAALTHADSEYNTVVVLLEN
ncbi:uncharacterized protein MEPE_02460 [Melanopsichium pennsylvanicum]|uniref:Mis18 domain-containing protein n=2 Tax=Melanopsichium pennsylvanicum TaxID=63383 RepID=A0AAJ4XK09_9BASI|nr:protein mis18-alpha [Melanopsichium pennsylvanicum 4]SNX83752.1 uncharacterized protein MEPE_02460 [Melanopsichium pennsylvanicum]